MVPFGRGLFEGTADPAGLFGFDGYLVGLELDFFDQLHRLPLRLLEQRFPGGQFPLAGFELLQRLAVQDVAGEVAFVVTFIKVQPAVVEAVRKIEVVLIGRGK
jgi:hypothetical protein